MRKPFKILLAVILVLSFIAVLFVMPVIDMTNKDDRHTVTIVYATEILEIEHSINYIIPFGKDYYYIGFDEDENAYIIHAPKNWDIENFPDDYDNPTEITALKKRTDYDIEKEISSRLNDIELNFPFGINCLELNYMRDSIMKIISGAVMLFLAILGFMNYKRKDEIPKPLIAVYAILLIIMLFLILTLIV